MKLIGNQKAGNLQEMGKILKRGNVKNSQIV